MKVSKKSSSEKTIAGSKNFQIAVNDTMFDLLSNNLYQHIELAIIRELSSNAVDATKTMPNAKQYEVALPTKENLIFSVQDFGIGMTEKQIYDNYCTYGASTKSNSNVEIGGFGLGSKSPFAYTNTFFIESSKNGIKNYFKAYRNEKGQRQVVLQKSEKSNETGTKVYFSVKEDDAIVFIKEAAHFYAFFEHTPNIINGKANLIDYFSDNIAYYKYTEKEYFCLKNFIKNSGFIKFNKNLNLDRVMTRLLSDECYIDIEGILYKVDNWKDCCTNKTLEKYKSLNLYLDRTTCILKANIGEVTLMPSRETVVIDDKTKKFIEKNINLAIDNYIGNIFDSDDNMLISNKLFHAGIKFFNPIDEEYSYSSSSTSDVDIQLTLEKLVKQKIDKYEFKGRPDITANVKKYFTWLLDMAKQFMRVNSKTSINGITAEIKANFYIKPNSEIITIYRDGQKAYKNITLSTAHVKSHTCGSLLAILSRINELNDSDDPILYNDIDFYNSISISVCGQHISGIINRKKIEIIFRNTKKETYSIIEDRYTCLIKDYSKLIDMSTIDISPLNIREKKSIDKLFENAKIFQIAPRFSDLALYSIESQKISYKELCKKGVKYFSIYRNNYMLYFDNKLDVSLKSQDLKSFSHERLNTYDQNIGILGTDEKIAEIDYISYKKFQKDIDKNLLNVIDTIFDKIYSYLCEYDNLENERIFYDNIKFYSYNKEFWFNKQFSLSSVFGRYVLIIGTKKKDMNFFSSYYSSLYSILADSKKYKEKIKSLHIIGGNCVKFFDIFYKHYPMLKFVGYETDEKALNTLYEYITERDTHFSGDVTYFNEEAKSLLEM